MRVDPPAVLRPDRVSSRTSAGFTHLVETIAKANEPTNTQLDALQRAYESTAEYLVTCPEFDGLLTQVFAHGSRQLGTIVRPSLQRDGWDVDLVTRLAREALFRYSGDQGPALLLRHLLTSLDRYASRHELGIERHERCVTLVYAGGMRADFAPVIDDPAHSLPHGDHHGRIPDRDLRRYLSTNPRGYCLGFDELARIRPNFPTLEQLAAEFAEAREAEISPLPDAKDVFGRLLSRYVQLGKIHRNVAFTEPSGSVADLRPNSAFLTSLLAAAYALEAPKAHDGPLDLLQDIAEQMPAMFQRYPMRDGAEHWELLNPTAKHDNLAGSMNDPAKQTAFWAWHRKFKADLTKIQLAIEHHRGMDEVCRLVEEAFGRPSALTLASDRSQRREAQRSAGRAVFLASGVTPVASRAAGHTFFGR